MVGSLLTDIGAEAAAVTALIVAVGLVAKSRPCKWVWRRNVIQPASAWFRAEVAHVVEPPLAEIREQLRPNGGKTLRDRVDRLEVGQGELVGKVDAIESRLARWEKEKAK